MHYSAFVDQNLLTQGSLETVITHVKTTFPDKEAIVIVTDTCERFEVNWQGELTDVLSRIDLTASLLVEPELTENSSTKTAPAKRGRPKLGVVSKEVTLLPRHWEWLAQQSGGASVTLRKLVDKARQERSVDDEIKIRQGQLYNFITIFAEQLPNVEEVVRALYRQDNALFHQSIQAWPADIKNFCVQKFIAIPV